MPPHDRTRMCKRAHPYPFPPLLFLRASEPAHPPPRLGWLLEQRLVCFLSYLRHMGCPSPSPRRPSPPCRGARLGSGHFDKLALALLPLLRAISILINPGIGGFGADRRSASSWTARPAQRSPGHADRRAQRLPRLLCFPAGRPRSRGRPCPPRAANARAPPSGHVVASPLRQAGHVKMSVGCACPGESDLDGARWEGQEGGIIAGSFMQAKINYF